MRKRLGIALVSVVCVAACTRQPASPGKDAASQGKIVVVATIFPLADWAAQVGGERVRAVTVLPAGSSPHTFEPTPRQMREIGDAQLFLTVGLHLDDWAARLSNAAPERLTTLSLGETLLENKQLPDVSHTLAGPVISEDGAEHEHSDHHQCATHAGVDPHYWLCPQLASQSVDEIQKALAALDPDHAEDYAQNASRYKEQLQQLDQELSSTLAPCKQRSFVTFHHAFGYFAHRYGLQVAAVIELYPGKTPSDSHVKQVADKLRSIDVKTIFTEPQMSPRVAEIIAREIGGKVDVLDPLGDAGSADRDSYVNLLRYNAQKMRKALCAE